jgi:GNAT superfamily N-acetyltransferase
MTAKLALDLTRQVKVGDQCSCPSLPSVLPRMSIGALARLLGSGGGTPGLLRSAMAPKVAEWDVMHHATIREVKTEDAVRVAGLLTQLGYPATADDVAERLAYWLHEPRSRILVAVRNLQVIGCLSIHAIPYLERTGWWARIESLVVDDAARRSGVARSLVQAAEETARQWGCLAMEVTSARYRSDAHAFYKQLGYTDVCDKSARFFKVFD